MDLVARGKCQKCNGIKVSGMPVPPALQPSNPLVSLAPTKWSKTIEQLFVLSRAWGCSKDFCPLRPVTPKQFRHVPMLLYLAVPFLCARHT